MKRLVVRSSISMGALGLAIALSTGAAAQSRAVTTANVTTGNSDMIVVVNGTTFINKGIQGAGRLDANTLDFRGETLGSFSGMALDLKVWRRNVDGSYSGGMFTLPDRGPYDGAIDYRNRVHTSNITFRPLAAGSAALPQAASSQSQLTITPTGGLTLKDSLGVEMTGRDPGASTVTRDGIIYPLATAGTAAGHVSLDAEAIAFRPDGTFYVSDEYADGIYYFDATGKQIGAIQTVAAMLPRTAGAVNFNSTSPGQTGRRNNQGLEAMALTPDNKKLVTIQQSATVQDTNGAAQQTRNNTRILVYDISNNPTPANPIGHYVLQLPVFSNNGSGTPDRTAAQSEVLALNDTQFLVLARDGIGRGIAANGSASPTPVFKSILLVDTASATNLAGTQYEIGATPIAANGALNAGIIPVQQVEMINLLNTNQLARVGMNLTRLPTSNSTTLSEKLEAMALAPVLEEGAPQDFFLFVGNDNDFQGTSICFNGVCSASGALDGTGNNDSVMLVYRLTLPIYVDPMALAALNTTAPDVLYGTRIALSALAGSASQSAMRFLNGQRGWAAGSDARRPQLWLDADRKKIGQRTVLTGLDAHLQGATFGLDLPLGKAVNIGAFAGYRTIEGNLAEGPLKAKAWSVGAYASIVTPQGIYAQASAAWLGNVKFTEIGRASAYSQQASGKAGAKGLSFNGEIGWTLGLNALSITPFAALEFVDAKLRGYTETGASVSNFTYPMRKLSKLTGSLGAEAAVELGALRPALRAGYSMEHDGGDKAAAVKLAAAQHAMGTVNLALADTERDTAFSELRIAMRDGPMSGYISGMGRWGRGEDDARVSMGVAYAF